MRGTSETPQRKHPPSAYSEGAPDVRAAPGRDVLQLPLPLCLTFPREESLVRLASPPGPHPRVDRVPSHFCLHPVRALPAEGLWPVSPPSVRGPSLGEGHPCISTGLSPGLDLEAVSGSPAEPSDPTPSLRRPPQTLGLPQMGSELRCGEVTWLMTTRAPNVAHLHWVPDIGDAGFEKQRPQLGDKPGRCGRAVSTPRWNGKHLHGLPFWLGGAAPPNPTGVPASSPAGQVPLLPRISAAANETNRGWEWKCILCYPRETGLPERTECILQKVRYCGGCVFSS